MKIAARVSGIVKFPEHPMHEGAFGLEGGEDVWAYRDTFRSVGEAMTWARKVLDGKVSPREISDGELLAPRTETYWNEAHVYVLDRHENKVRTFVDAPERRWAVESTDGTRYEEIVRQD